MKESHKAEIVSRSWRDRDRDSPDEIAVDTTGNTGSGSGSGSGSDAKLYPSMPSLPLLVKDDPLEFRTIPVGTLVKCQAVVDWAAQRFPVMICNVQRIARNQPTYLGRRYGTISRLKVHLKDKDFDLTEIVETASSRSTSAGASAEPSPEVWYCDSRELRRGANAGSEVDFVGVAGSLVAVDVVVKGLPVSSSSSSSAYSSGDVDGIVFKRTPLNAALPKRAGGGVTMAEGPPSDTAVGFAPGWRLGAGAGEAAGGGSRFDVRTLPWAALLQHLQ